MAFTQALRRARRKGHDMPDASQALDAVARDNAAEPANARAETAEPAAPSESALWVSGAAVFGVGAIATAITLRRGNVSERPGPEATLSLYRQLLRTVQRWPSVRKEAVLTGIRDEFRANMGDRDPLRIEKMLAEAHSGLKQLSHEAAEGARARATPRAPKGSWPPGREHRYGVAPQWALDELGLSSASPTLSEVKASYHERAKKIHPDCGGPAADAEAFKRLTKAWELMQKHLPATDRRAAASGKI